ncbi:MAG TPA: M48 family metallopeptidase [Bacteroidia bacterium]|nr:M48 family metallopeptidase [Bacteroidia bacterium]
MEHKFHSRHPALARRAVILAVLGYAGLLLTVLISAAVLVACVFFIVIRPGVLSIKLGLVFGLPAAVVCWTVLRSMAVRMHAPEGFKVTRGEAPALFSMIDEISRSAGGVSFHEVIITPEMNAAAAQVPRWGIFGGYRTYLILGLPLMDAMPPEEFKSVLAHEFAHLSHRDGRLGSWLYRLRSSWERVIDGLRDGAPAPVRWFVNWFWPHFNSHAFVLSRSQEYRADAFAASVTSPEAAARALCRLTVEDSRLGEAFWNSIQHEVKTSARPPEDLFLRMQSFFRTTPEEDASGRSLAQALGRETDGSDTHPALSDRLAALGVSPSAAAPWTSFGESAAEAWLGSSLAERVRREFSRNWQDAVAPGWEDEHREYMGNLELLAATEKPGSDQEISEWDRILLRARVSSPAAVQEEILSLLERSPDHALAHYSRGAFLAEASDDAAIHHLETAARLNPFLTMEVLNELAGLYGRTSRSEEIASLKHRADQHEEKLACAERELNDVSKKAVSFIPHDLAEQEIEPLLEAFAGNPVIHRAWIARRDVLHFPEWKTYVIVIDPRWGFMRFVTDTRKQQLLSEVLGAWKLEAHITVLIREGQWKSVAKTISRIPGSLIYQKQ